MNFFRHLYYAIRYGTWEWDWEMYEGKPMFTVGHFYHDGDWVALHLYKLWITVHY